MFLALIAAATAFNLVCTGIEWSAPTSTTIFDQKDGKPFTDTYRVNLQAGRWCFEKCETTFPVKAWDETQIVLENDPTPNLQRYIWISRESGALVHRVVLGPTVFLRNGKCEATPFTSFPHKF